MCVSVGRERRSLKGEIGRNIQIKIIQGIVRKIDNKQLPGISIFNYVRHKDNIKAYF